MTSDRDEERGPLSPAEREAALRAYLNRQDEDDADEPDPGPPSAPPPPPRTRVDPEPGPPSGTAPPLGPAPEAPRPTPRPPSGSGGAPAEDRPPAPGAIRLGVWGAVFSGKSTFLHVLPTAINRRGDWTITAMNEQSRFYLTQANTLLHGARTLPASTQAGDHLFLDWRFEQARRRDPRRPWRLRDPRRIELRMTDRSGSHFADPDEALVTELAQAHGLVYLFDTVREFRDKDAYAFFGATMDWLRQHLAQRDGLLPGGKLPHHLAVCVAKLDDPPVYSRAREGHWLTQQRRYPYRPHVADRDAQGFFDWLCDHAEAGSAATVRDQIRANFDARRVRYYVSSAVGFRVEPGHGVPLERFDNIQQVQGRQQFVGEPDPINVAEPLLDLDAAVRRTR